MGPVFAEAELNDAICRWYIADGSANREFGAEFTDPAGVGDYGSWDAVPTAVVDEVSRRTPGFPGWQQERWWTHCGDAAEFLGRAGRRELESKWPDAVPAATVVCLQLNQDHRPQAFLPFIHSVHMTSQVASEAMIPNPRLSAFKPLIGTWTTVGHHSMMPGITLHGRTAFEWHEGGAFLRMRSEIEEEGIPSAVALIGSDDDGAEFTMLYFDERATTRRFEVTMVDRTLRWWRTAPGFSQRYVLTVGADGDSLHGVSSLSKDDKTWAQDLELSYTRAK